MLASDLMCNLNVPEISEKPVSSCLTESFRTPMLALVTIAANNFAVPLINSEAQPWDLPSVAELVSCA